MHVSCHVVRLQSGTVSVTAYCSFFQVHSTRMRYWGSGIDWSAKGVGLGFMVYAHYHNKYLEFCGMFAAQARSSRAHRLLVAVPTLGPIAIRGSFPQDTWSCF